MRLTDSIVKKLPIPPKGSKIAYDDDGPAGFGVRVTQNNSRSFIIRYRTKSGRERCMTIGSITTWRVGQARAESRKIRQLVDMGGDPFGDLQEQRNAPTVRELCERFEAEHLPRLRPSTRQDYSRILANHVLPSLGNTKVADVRFGDVDALHRKLTTEVGPYCANRVCAVLSKMFSLAIKWEYRENNPVRGVEKNPEESRRRYLSSDELLRLTAALAAHHDQQAADIVRVLLLSGCRRGEALGMRWADIDLTAGTWNRKAADLKQGRDHSVPLSAPARQLLSGIREAQVRKSAFVFPGRHGRDSRKSIKRNFDAILKSANIDNFRLHDARHSYASFAVGGGASLVITGALLGHATAATTQRYAHLADDPLRQVTERIGALIAGNPVAEVTKMKG